MNREILKKKKLLVTLIIITGISLVVGLLFISILSSDNKELIKSSVNNYFIELKNNNINYFKEFISCFSSNIFINLFIWIIGISIIGIFIVIGILIYKSFLVGFSFLSIIYTYGFKGILVASIYIIPEVINLFIVFVLVYYSVSFSILLFNYLFKKKDITRRVIMVRYIKILIFMVIGTIINSFISSLVIPNILRFI